MDDSSTVHKFWSTQPVPQPGVPESKRVGPVDKPKTPEDVSTEPLAIPSTFEWWTPNIEDAEDMNAIYELLRDNYVEDNGSIFRFRYSVDFLRWALAPPGYNPTWHVGVRRKRDKLMLGFVSGIPMKMRMGVPKELQKKRGVEMQKAENEAGKKAENEVEKEGEKEAEEEVNDYLEPRLVCEINFLCVHKQLRDKRVAPILIQEVTRRVNLSNIWQAIYTSGKRLPTPFSTAQYFHRSLNPEKLVAVSFASVPKALEKFQNPMAMLKRFLQLPEEPKTNGLRPMELKDVPQVTKLLREKMASYDVTPVFDEEDIAHHLLPREDLLTCYVVEREVNDPEGTENIDADDDSSGKEGNNDKSRGNSKGKKENNANNEKRKTKGKKKRKCITDFFSFYLLPSTVIGNSTYPVLNAAYVYYYAANSVPLAQLMGDLLIIANKKGYDVCNLVEIADNGMVWGDLKFSPGDGYLNFYFYNWSYPKVDPSMVFLCML